MNIGKLVIKQRQAEKDARRPSSGGACSQFTWLNFRQGRNQQDSNGKFVTPAVPTGLVATPGDNHVLLTWNLSSTATSYNIKRSLVTGGPYVTIGTSGAGTYDDLTAVNGTPYFYVVSAVNFAGESANSSEVTATPFDPFVNNITLVHTSGPNTVINAPAGAYNFSVTVPQVTEIHCHSAPGVTSITCATPNAALLVVDIKDCDGIDMDFHDTPLTTINLDTFVSIGTLNVTNCTSMGSLSAANLVSIDDLNADTCGLASINWPNLVSADNINLNLCPGLLAASFNSLVSVGVNFVCTSGGVISFDLSSLQTVGNYLLLNTNADLLVVDLPALTSVGGLLYLQDCPALTSISAPSLLTVPQLYFDRDHSLTSADFSALTNIDYLSMFQCESLLTMTFNDILDISGQVDAYDCTSLVSWTAPVMTGSGISTGGGLAYNGNTSFTTYNAPNVGFGDGFDITFFGCALTQASVDLILARCVASGLTTNNIDLSGGTNATPSAAGLLDVATLIGNGCSVTTN